MSRTSLIIGLPRWNIAATGSARRQASKQANWEVAVRGKLLGGDVLLGLKE